jgi:putative transposase
MKLKSDYPVKMLCDLLALPRSSWYYRSVERDERDLQKAVEQVIGQFPTYGSRRVAHQLRREHSGFKVIGRKRVRRVLGEMGLKLRRKTIKKQTTDSRHCFPRYENLVKELDVVRPDQVWVGAITYIRLGDGTFIYLAILMDVFTRIIRGWAIGSGLGVELTLQALHRALARGRPEIHHSDQGLQYAATDYVVALEQRKVQISMAAVGHAEENGYAERVIRTIKEEEVALNEYPDLISAKLYIGRFIDDVYCTKRIHSSLGYLTPAEFAAQWSERSL